MSRLAGVFGAVGGELVWVEVEDIAAFPLEGAPDGEPVSGLVG